MKRTSRSHFLIGFACAGTIFTVACGGSEAAAPAVVVRSPTPEPGATVDYSKGIKVPIPAAGYITSVALTPTPEAPAGTPTPIPPPVTLSEKITAVLIDTLVDTPRTSARQIVSDYRDDVAAADAKYKGKPVVIQGTVKEAGIDSGGKPYVLFAAGAGTLKCKFVDISQPELLRLTPGGTNAAVGTVEAYDRDQLLATAGKCQLVLGY